MSVFSRLVGVVALLVALAGMAQAADKIEVGYMPIVPDAQVFVILEGLAGDNPLKDTKLIEFQNGPAIVQALLAGQLDVAYVGIGPAMVARSKGADLRVVAGNIINQINLLALGDLAPYFAEGDAATAFARFTKDHGRKPVITTFPRGSVPDTVLQYWLKNKLHVSSDSLQIIYQGAAQAQQALLTGAVDGAAILEPITSNVLVHQPKARVVATGSALFPDQPGAVLLVRQQLIDKHPDYVKKLVAAQLVATRKLRDHPEDVVAAVQKYVGGGRLPAKVVLAALKRTGNGFEANPHEILKGTQRMYEFQRKQGTLRNTLDVNALFDMHFYDQLK